MTTTVTYLDFRTPENTSALGSRGWQNLYTMQTRFIGGVPYAYADFRITDATGVSGGDRSSGELVLPKSRFGRDLLLQVRNGNLRIRSRSFAVDEVEQEDTVQLTDQLWKMGEMEITTVQRVRLISALDAVEAQTNRLRLTEGLVGLLPDGPLVF